MDLNTALYKGTTLLLESHNEKTSFLEKIHLLKLHLQSNLLIFKKHCFILDLYINSVYPSSTCLQVTALALSLVQYCLAIAYEAQGWRVAKLGCVGQLQFHTAKFCRSTS